MLWAQKTAALALLGAVGLATALTAGSAEADVAPTTACTLTGTALPAIDTVLYEGPAGSTSIAKLTGGKLGLTASDFLAGGGDRVHVKTSSGSAGFRLEGFIDAKNLPVFTTKNVAVVPNHFWIAGQREVTVIGSGSAQLRVKRQVGLPFGQAFMAWAPCSALSLTQSTPTGWSPAGSARAYVAKKTVELYDGPDEDRKLVTVLTPDSTGDGIVLWSTQKKKGWVHLVHHSDVVVDAWARARDLKALPRGETQDFQPPPASRRNPPSLALSGNAKTATSPKDLQIRSSASDKGKAIGTLEAGAEVYVLDVVAGWASVLPKALNIAPHGDGQFWVRAKALGVAP
jgi:hypothetical protein